MGSPFLKDFNYLIDLKHQMGVLSQDIIVGDYIPNATKCMTWRDIKATHETDTTPTIRITEIYVIIILMASCLGVATVAFLMECLSIAIIQRFKKKPCPKLNTSASMDQ